MNNHNNIISFFIKHPKYFIKLISQYYPFEETHLEKYENILDWDLISTNEAIVWDEKMILIYIKKLNWKAFSVSSTAFKNLSFIDTFKNDIYWQDPDQNLFSTFANNTKINWTIELIGKYEHLWDYYQMSYNELIPWNESLIDKHLNEWDWGYLSGNSALPWSINFFEKYQHFFEKDSYFFSINPSLINNIELIEKYSHELSWFAICSNSNLPWQKESLLNRWIDKIDWDGIARNELLLSQTYFFENNINKWLSKPIRAFHFLSGNKALPWTIEFIDRFIDHWDWERLSQNEGLPWSIEFIEQYSDKWQWGGVRLVEYSIDENGIPDYSRQSEQIELGLIDNAGLPWSIDFINYYESKMDLGSSICKDTIWEKAFKPYVDEKMIEIVYSKI